MPDEKVFVVTGVGPGSLGEATAAALREHGRVITTRRSGSASADFHPLDLADAGSVRAFADWLGTATDRSTYWSTTPASTSTCAASGTSRSCSTVTRSTGAPTTSAPLT